MFNKSLIQFSVNGQGCVPSLLLDLGPNYGGGNEDNGDLLQKVPAYTAALMPPNLQQATADPGLHQRLMDTHGQVWVSPLGGHCSFLLHPDAHKVLFVLSKSRFPQSCVSSGGSMVGIMATCKGLMPYPGLLHPELLRQATAHPHLHRRHSDMFLAQCL